VEYGIIEATPIFTLTAGQRKEALALVLELSQVRDAKDPRVSIDMASLHDFFKFRRSVYLSPYPSKYLSFGRHRLYLMCCCSHKDGRWLADHHIDAALQLVYSLRSSRDRACSLASSHRVPHRRCKQGDQRRQGKPP
jgi:hypothetical protein